MLNKHSVLLKEDKCEGCTNCVKNCPTKAIRVHQGKATIKEELCIDCAECIRTCAYHAKYTETAEFIDLEDYAYPVALLPPSFYGQYRQTNPEKIKTALLQLGFKGVYDVARAAEGVTEKTIHYLREKDGLFISSSCPVIVRLIKILYPELLTYLMPIKTPVELEAQLLRNKLEEEGVSPEDIGVYFITPCPAKLTAIKNPLGMVKSYLDRAIAVEKVYAELIKILNTDEDVSQKPTEKSSVDTSDKQRVFPYSGISWGQDGGEADLLKGQMEDQILAVSGIHSVKKVLEELVRNNIKGLKYLELAACTQGCIGGVLNAVNPYQARLNLQQMVSQLRKNKEKGQEIVLQQKKELKLNLNGYDFSLDREFQAEDVARLDTDFQLALEKLAQLENETEILPGLDCAACGAPDCATLAEDIVTGKAQRSDCPFVLRKQVGDLADQLSELAHALPPVMKNNGDRKQGEKDAGKGNS